MARTTAHKEGKATVKVIYRTTKTLKDGSHPFWLRITKDRKSTYIATGLTLHPKSWNEKYSNYKDAIRKNLPDGYRDKLIDKLVEWETKYTKAANDLAESDEQHNTRTVASKAIEGRKKARSLSLLRYMDELIDSFTTARQLGNARVYRNVRNQLATFLQNEDVPFSQVTVKLCKDFEQWQRSRGNSDTYISVLFRTLRAVINKAIAEGIAKPEHYPFARNVAEKYKFSVGQFDTSTEKRAISRDEIRRIEAFEPIERHTGKWATIKNTAEIERLRRAKHVFLFSFYCGGINFVDLAQLRWSNFDSDENGATRLRYIRQKTGGKFNIRLVSPALEILNYYRLSTHAPNEYVFDILQASTHKTPAQTKNRLDKILSQVNADLKIIAAAVDIETPLTTYVARHSFATSLKRSGTHTAVISQAMGHKTEAITAIYLDSFASEIVDSAYDALL